MSQGSTHEHTSASGQPAIEARELTRRFGPVTALDHVTVDIRKGEFFSLLGPSGCGKTTLLRLIAGLDLPDEGTLKIAGKDMRGIPAHKRPVNTVFQSYALFPHLSVESNVAFGLRMKGVPQADMDRRVAKIMEMVEITEFAERRPAQLSGGQRQRVALARAVVNEPEVLLLDEPLGALDLKLRKQLQIELMTLQRRLGITFICVTHDQEEALTMSDRIAVMNAGRIEQLGDAEHLYENPRTRFVGQFLGSINLIEARVKERGAGGCRVQTEVGDLDIDFGERTGDAARRESFTAGIRPEKVNLLPASEGAGQNRFKVKVTELIYIGSETHYVLKAGGLTLTCEVMNAKCGSQGFDVGAEAIAYLPPGGLVALDD